MRPMPKQIKKVKIMALSVSWQKAIFTVIALFLVVNLVSDLFSSLKSLFSLY